MMAVGIHIRIMPYWTLDEKVDGVVITFFNISDLKEVELNLHENKQMNKFLLNSSSDIIIKLSTDWKIHEINPAAEKYFGKKLVEIVRKNYFHMFIPASFREKTEKELNKILKKSDDTRYQNVDYNGLMEKPD